MEISSFSFIQSYDVTRHNLVVDINNMICYNELSNEREEIKMIIYLIFGASEYIPNDNYLYGVATSLLEAQEKIQKASFCGKTFDELDEITQDILLTEIIPVNKNDIQYIEECGIYKIKI